MSGILKGKKTYIVGVLAVIGAVVSYFTGDLTIAQAGQACLTAILGMTIRNAL